MEKKNLDNLIEGFFEDKSLSYKSLLSMINEQIEESGYLDKKQTITEEEKRFSFTIPIPKWTPSEAWGDPSSQDRKEIQRIFRAVTGGNDIKARITSINKFLNPASARRKRSPSSIINMMMITEALQATLNDYNESAAGFVFEGFMSALTGGKQIAGKVAGTLPIEDFVAFSDFGADQPVSLKLLSAKTPVKGSFTNIVDFLLVRGSPAIKYLVAYKQTTGEDVVEKLNIYAFDITRENFIDFIQKTGGGKLLQGKGVSINRLKKAISAFSADPSKLGQLAQLVVRLGGYTRSGLLHKYIASGELPSEPSPGEKEAEAAALTARRYKDYMRTLKTSHPLEYEESQAAERERRRLDRAAANQAKKALSESIDRSLNRNELTLNEAFHYIEKQTLLLEDESTKSQWEASLPQLEKMGSMIKWEPYGELDLSQSNIAQLAEIYAEKLEGGVMQLLTKAKDLTENVGAYYSVKRRNKATAAANQAKGDAEDIKTILEEDPRYTK